MHLVVGLRWALAVEGSFLVEGTAVDSVVVMRVGLEDLVPPLVTSAVGQIITLETAKLRQ